METHLPEDDYSLSYSFVTSKGDNKTGYYLPKFKPYIYKVTCQNATRSSFAKKKIESGYKFLESHVIMTVPSYSGLTCGASSVAGGSIIGPIAIWFTYRLCSLCLSFRSSSSHIFLYKFSVAMHWTEEDYFKGYFLTLCLYAYLMLSVAPSGRGICLSRADRALACCLQFN